VALGGPQFTGLLRVREKSMSTFNAAMDCVAPAEEPVSYVN